MRKAELVAILLCPVALLVLVVGAACVGLVDAPRAEWLLRLVTPIVIGVMPMCGVACLYWSWRRHRDQESSQHDIHEFLLGFFGCILLVFGVVLSPWPLSMIWEAMSR